MIVDDQEANVVLLQRLLAGVGVSDVSGWTDPRAALTRCVTDPPDLLLLDLRMPQLDGIAFLRALQSRLPSHTFVPVLVLTADKTPEARETALAAGAADFVTKPFDTTEVLLRVRNMLTTRALYADVQDHNQRLQAELDEQNIRERARQAERQYRLNRLEEVLATGALTIVVQPIARLDTLTAVGVEALTRIRYEPIRPPDLWFKEAAELGIGTRVELAAVGAALDILPRLPADQFLSINASPHTAQVRELADLLESVGDRVVLELTEHAQVANYNTLNQAVDRLRRHGVRLAIDDAGAGYASLQHILKLRPDIIKLDTALTNTIHADPARKALASALVTFAQDINATIIAEGIETAQDLDTLQSLGIPWGQGYYLARPAPIKNLPPPWAPGKPT